MPTKAELMEQAQTMGLEVDDSMTKDELQSLIDQAETAPEEVERVCVQCGEPAVYKTTNPAVNEVYYCQAHGTASGEAMESLTAQAEPTQ
jgi:exoribonuclease R